MPAIWIARVGARLRRLYTRHRHALAALAEVEHEAGRRDEAVIFDTLALSVYAANRNPRRPPA